MQQRPCPCDVCLKNAVQMMGLENQWAAVRYASLKTRHVYNLGVRMENDQACRLQTEEKTVAGCHRPKEEKGLLPLPP